jgi:tetratricopeptide (TPR) repeat protein
MNPERFPSSVRPPLQRAARLLLAIAAVALAIVGWRAVDNRLAVRAALAEGEDAFRRGEFRDAAAKFRSALDLDPKSTTIRLRLVAAQHKQYVPGGDSRANLEIATQTLDEIARVLEGDPSSRRAIVAAAEIAEARSDYDQARNWYRRLVTIDSASATALAGLSAASLKEVSGAVFDAEAQAGLLPSSGRPIANDDMRKALAERWSATIAEGIDAGTRAVALDRENHAVMLMLSAWHALAADLAASPDEYQQHMTSADDWRHNAHEARRAKAERGPR